MKCPFCGNGKTEGSVLVMCYLCGVRWEKAGEQRIVGTLEFDGTGKQWWWNRIDQGLLVTRPEGES